MLPQDTAENFVQSQTTNTTRIYGYIYSLVGDHHRAADVMQECNLVLWRKSGEFREGCDFLPWAFAIARFQAMPHFRDQKRDRLHLVDDEVADLLASELEEQAGDFEEMRIALRHCVAKLPDNSRQLIDLRYFRKLSIQSVADEVARKLSAVKIALMRIRHGLKDCVEREMGKADQV